MTDRPSLEAAARGVAAALGEFLPSLRSVLWKGSAFKPWEGPFDFLPGLSDLDVHAFVPGGLPDPWRLRRHLFSRVRPPVSLQLLVFDSESPPDWLVEIPGSYQVLAGGEPPRPEDWEELVRRRDREGLMEAADQADTIRQGVVDRSDQQLWPYLRRVRWMFSPMLQRATVAAGEPPQRVWALNRTRLLASTAGRPELVSVRRAMLAYLEAALAAGRAPGDPVAVEAALRAGHDLLTAAAAWSENHPSGGTIRPG